MIPKIKYKSCNKKEKMKLIKNTDKSILNIYYLDTTWGLFQISNGTIESVSNLEQISQSMQSLSDSMNKIE